MVGVLQKSKNYTEDECHITSIYSISAYKRDAFVMATLFYTNHIKLHFCNLYYSHIYQKSGNLWFMLPSNPFLQKSAIVK